MTHNLTHDAELDRQLKAVRRGETDVIVCPWCGVFNNSESGDCCAEIAEARQRMAIENLKRIESQFKRVRNGLGDASVQCPYCDAINRPENLESPAHWKRPMRSPWCCDLMVIAVMSVGERMRQQDLVDHMHRIQDNVAKVNCN
jgi:hypothetical protein